MRITESRLRRIIRSVIAESVQTKYDSSNLEIKDHVREARGGNIVSVKHCGDDPEYANDIYILVSLSFGKRGAIVYQDNSDNSQMIESGASSFDYMQKEFDKITMGEELFKLK